MSKNSKSKVVSINVDVLGDKGKYSHEIIAGAISDGKCNYSYEITGGVGEGNSHSVKGTHIVHDDMPNAMQLLNVHLACIDDVFKHTNTDVKNIDKMHNNELTALYEVTGFKIKSAGDSEAVVLIGTKAINCSGGRVDLITPKIPLDGTSSYEWYNELAKAVETIRNEVDEYHNGKYIIEEEKVDPKQTNLLDGETELEEELESNRV